MRFEQFTKDSAPAFTPFFVAFVEPPTEADSVDGVRRIKLWAQTFPTLDEAKSWIGSYLISEPRARVFLAPVTESYHVGSPPLVISKAMELAVAG